jgi:hypothetical protein
MGPIREGLTPASERARESEGGGGWGGQERGPQLNIGENSNWREIEKDRARD